MRLSSERFHTMIIMVYHLNDLDFIRVKIFKYNTIYNTSELLFHVPIHHALDHICWHPKQQIVVTTKLSDTFKLSRILIEVSNNFKSQEFIGVLRLLRPSFFEHDQTNAQTCSECWKFRNNSNLKIWSLKQDL